MRNESDIWHNRNHFECQFPYKYGINPYNLIKNINLFVNCIESISIVEIIKNKIHNNIIGAIVIFSSKDSINGWMFTLKNTFSPIEFYYTCIASVDKTNRISLKNKITFSTTKNCFSFIVAKFTSNFTPFCRAFKWFRWKWILWCCVYMSRIWQYHIRNNGNNIQSKSFFSLFVVVVSYMRL